MDDELWIWFSLQGLLPEGSELCVNTEIRSITQCYERKITSHSQQALFSEREFPIALALLRSYPYHASHAELLQAYQGGTVEEQQELINYAFAHGDFDVVARAMRNQLSRVRVKLRQFGINAVSMIETGYMLLVLPPVEKRSGVYEKRRLQRV